MEGYFDGLKKVDVKWWETQVKLGAKDREVKTKEANWPSYQAHYRNEYDGTVYPKNMFFILSRTIVPKIYYRNPKISIVAKQPGPEHQAFSKVLERVDNILIDAMNLKVEMKRMVNESFFHSMGVMKLLFGAEYTPTPILGITAPPITDDGFRPEYRPSVIQNMPYVKHIPTNEFVMAEKIKEVEETFFQAHIITRYWDDLENDPRFPLFKKHARVKPGIQPISDKDTVFKNDNSRRTVELIEIRDRRTRKVIVLAPDVMEDNIPLLYQDDELQTAFSSPFYTYTPNIDTDNPYGVADADVLITAQEQLNDINTKVHMHAKLSLVKWLSEKNAISQVEATKLLNEDIGAIVQVANARGLTMVDSHHIPEALIQEKREIMEDMRELVGFSRNSLAQFQAVSHGPTATEVNAVNAAAELRTDERRDMIADNIVTMFKDLHQVIFRHWDQEQVVKLVGDNGLPVWVQFTGKMLEEGSYDIQIEPDSSVPETREVRESRASNLYNELKIDPNIDPRKLTAYRLHETPGVAIDDLMKAEEVPQGGNVLSMDQFAGQQQGVA